MSGMNYTSVYGRVDEALELICNVWNVDIK